MKKDFIPSSYKLIIFVGILCVTIPIMFLTRKENVHVKDVHPPTPTIMASSYNNVIISGKYTCLENKSNQSKSAEDCSFGIITDDGKLYAVNFGQTSAAFVQFKNGMHIKAVGFIVPKENIDSTTWADINIQGLFTINKLIEPAVRQLEINEK